MVNRLRRQTVEARSALLRQNGQVGAARGLGQELTGVTLLVDVADGHLRRVAQPPERGFDALAHQPVGLALRLEHLRTDIGGTLAEADRQEGWRRDVDTDELRVEPLRQPPGALDARIDLRVVEQLEENRAIAHDRLPALFADGRPRLMADGRHRLQGARSSLSRRS